MVLKKLTSLIVVGTALAVAAPQAASAATKPGVTTGGASNVVQQSARIAGSIDPNGATTTYSFQYGTSTAYGATTPALSLSGDGAKSVSVDLTGLTPNKRYYYRLIASNSAGETLGARKSFVTLKQPLGITLAANPNPVPFGSMTTLAGQVTGTGNGGVQVALQGRAFPYTTGFKQVGNAVIADAQGNFSFGLLPVGLNTQFRAVRVGKSLTSQVVLASVAVRVATNVGTYRVRKGSLLTFSGTLKPALPGTLLAVQKKDSKGRWQLIGGMAARTSNSEQAKFKRRVRIRSAGTYRIYAGAADGRYVPAVGREIKIRTR